MIVPRGIASRLLSRCFRLSSGMTGYQLNRSQEVRLPAVKLNNELRVARLGWPQIPSGFTRSVWDVLRETNYECVVDVFFSVFAFVSAVWKPVAPIKAPADLED